MFGRYSDLREINARLTRIEDLLGWVERTIVNMPNRQDFDQAMADLHAGIGQVMQKLKDLESRANSGDQITAQDIIDLREDVSELAGNVVPPNPDPGPPPVPGPEPVPPQP